MVHAHSRSVRRATLAVSLGALIVAPAAVVQAQDAPKLVMWGWPTTVTSSFDENGEDVLVQRVKDELGIDLEVQLVEQNELGAKLKAALPAGQGPDILATDFDVMGPYWSFMQPLDAFAEADWGADWRASFSDASMDEQQLVSEIAEQPGSALYMPGNMQLLGWAYYKRDALEAAGVDPAAIASFDDFINACAAIEATGQPALIMGSHPAGLVDLYQTLVEVAAPGQMELAQRGQASFTDPAMASTFDLIARVYNDCAQDGAIAAEIVPVVFNGFFTGPGAMSLQFTGTPWFPFVTDPEAKDYMNTNAGTFLFPGSKGLAATDGGLAIPKDSDNAEAAWELIKWFVAGQEAERIAARGEPIAWKAIQPKGNGTDFDTFLQQPLLDALANGDNKFRRILCVDVYNALTTVIPGVVQGQIDAATAAAEVQDAFDRGCEEWVQS